MINLSNYEDWFLLYADGELTVEEQEAVLQFVKQHPSLQEELDLMMNIRFQPETEIKLADHSNLTAEYFNELENTYRFEPDLNIQYPDKAKLYKRTAAPVFPIFRYASVAASTIVTAGIIWWFMGTASVEQPLVKTEIQIAPEVNNSETVTILPQKNFLNTDGGKVNTTTGQVAFVADIKPEEFKLTEQQNIQLPQGEELMQEVVINEKFTPPIDADKSNSNFSQEAIQAAVARMNGENSNKIASNTMPDNISPTINTAMLIEAELDTERQLPVRGLLRKISRKFLGERNEEGAVQKYVQLAVFSIPVQQ